ncbi:hypothetical protein M1M87_01195 [Thermodesulfovibrionales bacterium]|nr:hypothetical protein [Thermodesulfovibrionales bacterium]MCL0066896.1 hypothetical protein [Thermodesulfovibrionales bacterium]
MLTLLARPESVLKLNPLISDKKSNYAILRLLNVEISPPREGEIALLKVGKSRISYKDETE